MKTEWILIPTSHSFRIARIIDDKIDIIISENGDVNDTWKGHNRDEYQAMIGVPTLDIVKIEEVKKLFRNNINRLEKAIELLSNMD